MMPDVQIVNRVAAITSPKVSHLLTCRGVHIKHVTNLIVYSVSKLVRPNMYVTMTTDGLAVASNTEPNSMKSI